MNILYSWEFEDKKDRWPYWYIIALSIIIWIAIWWFMTGQYGMSFVVLFISWIFYFIENNSEDIVKVILTDVWIQIWKSFYEYTKIVNYSYIYENDTPIFLRLVINKVSLKNMDLNIDQEILKNLKNILPNYMEEDTKWELSVMEKLIHKLKL
jgi:ABC-type multidrug transport system fused ATPase/permease subunit